MADSVIRQLVNPVSSNQLVGGECAEGEESWGRFGGRVVKAATVFAGACFIKAFTTPAGVSITGSSISVFAFYMSNDYVWPFTIMSVVLSAAWANHILSKNEDIANLIRHKMKCGAIKRQAQAASKESLADLKKSEQWLENIGSELCEELQKNLQDLHIKTIKLAETCAVQEITEGDKANAIRMKEVEDLDGNQQEFAAELASVYRNYAEGRRKEGPETIQQYKSEGFERDRSLALKKFILHNEAVVNEAKRRQETDLDSDGAFGESYLSGQQAGAFRLRSTLNQPESRNDGLRIKRTNTTFDHSDNG